MMAMEKRGRPKIQYDKKVAEQVQAMSQYGTPQEEIAEMIGISAPTLRKLYKKELGHGFNLAKLGVRKKIYERCMAGDNLMLIFYAKTQLGWKEVDKNADKSQSADNARQLTEAIRDAFRSVGKCRS